MSTISDFVPKVRSRMGGRTDIDARITDWLAQAYQELAEYDLETLETSDTFATVDGTDSYAYPTDARAIKSLVLLNDTTPVPLTKKNINIVRRYQTANEAVPAIWAPYGANILLRPVPNDTYTVNRDYWLKPQIDIEDSESTKNAVDVLLPLDWNEILIASAVEKGHLELVERDKAMEVHQLIHGDPHPTKGFPGMLKERLNRNAMENASSEYGMRPRIRRYTSGR